MSEDDTATHPPISLGKSLPGIATSGAEHPPRSGGVAPLRVRPPFSKRSSTRIGAVLVVLAVIAAVIVFVVVRPWSVVAETVRVTDGGTLLVDDLAQVESLIQAENKRVSDSGTPFVSIAYMFPIRVGSEDRSSRASVRHQLEGAYLAQYWSNHPDGTDRPGAERPPIKLLIADTGSEGRDYLATVKDLVDRKAAEHLVAVAGLGLSVQNTKDSIAELERHGLPMVATAITSTEFRANGLVQVPPTNADEAAAAIAYLRTTPEWRAATADRPYVAYLMQDMAGVDSYASDLGREYRAVFAGDAAHRFLDAEGRFDGSKQAAGNALKNQIGVICSVRPTVVFFAGRSGNGNLSTFLNDLAARHCTDTHITVVTGDDTDFLNAELPSNAAPLWVDTNANLTVLYTSLASPLTWLNRPKEVSAQAVARFTGACATCFTTLFRDSLEDGQAIMAYDATLTAVVAVRNVTDERNPQPSPDALINGFYQITASAPVNGASGWIYFQRSVGGAEGVPYNKAMPILQLHPNGTATWVDLTSRTGSPPGPPTQPR